MIEINFHPSKRELRTFSLLSLVFLAIIGWVVARKTGSMIAGIGIGSVGILIAGLGCTVPKVVRPIYVGLMIVNYPIGWVVTHAVMAAIFYLVVTPVGVIMRLFGRDPMERGFDRSAKTYWKPRSTDTNPSRYFRQF